MEEKLDALFEKLERMFTGWLDEFERQPVRMAVKVFVILYLLKRARRFLR